MVIISLKKQAYNDVREGLSIGTDTSVEDILDFLESQVPAGTLKAAKLKLGYKEVNKNEFPEDGLELIVEGELEEVKNLETDEIIPAYQLNYSIDHHKQAQQLLDFLGYLPDALKEDTIKFIENFKPHYEDKTAITFRYIR